ncbi:MAG: UDP-2,3-diacylglucosamine diphosphatase [Flavobacteriales bacterium]|nr:UDP-2,3-diacylglucosamine diphosphatase [Flavobacteriales bacterium]MCX7650634.1 UDP-2,3-diacylglucosamine diphosphatase [Flavobacteriales bacterium]MDW8432701.1 UDP-2,3-diacylglucosamine diphosphatase [Flavobacteriales bacterium]
MKKEKREVEIVVISDVHLGTYGCHAEELNAYLKSISPRVLVLNGDIIDIWNFSKNYWPKAHMKVVNRILKMIVQGVKVYYVTGNHDEMLRRFSDFHLANFSLVDKLIIEVQGQKTWIFHGDVFDPSIINAKWLAKIGGKGYDLLILMNRTINHLLLAMGKERVSISKMVKNKVKRAVKYIADFEETAVEMAIHHGYDTVICGHIHQPSITFRVHNGHKILYLNSGDWVENLTALEFSEGQWSLYKHQEMGAIEEDDDNDDTELADEFAPVVRLLDDLPRI